MKLFYLSCYAIITCLITVRAFIKKKNIIYCVLWCEYAVSATFCVLCKIFQAELVGFSAFHNRWYDLSDSTWWGYALLIMCNLVAFKPFELFDLDFSLGSMGKTKGAREFEKFYAYTYILLAFIFAILSYANIKSIFQVSDFGSLRTSLYSNSDNESILVITDNIIANICFKLCMQFKYLSVYVALLMFKERYRVKLAIGLVVITFGLYYVYATANAARGGLLIFTFCAFLMVLTFFKYMSATSKKKLILLCAIGGGIVVSFFLAVTISRVAKDSSGGNIILRNVSFYLGHGPIEFSKITGTLDEYAYGKTIGGRLLKHYFGVPYSWEDIQMDIGYPEIGPVFVTYLGYIYTDFGVFSAVGFTCLWSYIMCRLIKKRGLCISTIFLFLYYLNFYVTGNFTIGRLEYAGLITAHVVSFGIRCIEDTFRNRRSQGNLLRRI